MKKYTITQNKITHVLDPISERRIVRLYMKDNVVVRQENVQCFTVIDSDGNPTDVEMVTDKSDEG